MEPVKPKDKEKGKAKAEKKEEVKFDYYQSEEEAEENKEEESEEPAVQENKPKLSKKELKKLKKQAEYQKQLESMEAGGVENFTVSQAEKSAKATVLDSQDIKVENFSIAAKGKDLFVNASLYITAGRRYGLVGPNGHGKTTLLNHMAKKILNIPQGIDILLCEQEIVADETKSIDSVLKADKVRTALLEEEKKLLVEVEKGNTKINDRLKEVSSVSVSSPLPPLRFNTNYFYCKYLVRSNDDFYFCVIYYISYYFIIPLYIIVEKKMIKDRKVCTLICTIL